LLIHEILEAHGQQELSCGHLASRLPDPLIFDWMFSLVLATTELPANQADVRPLSRVTDGIIRYFSSFGALLARLIATRQVYLRQHAAHAAAS
jgi:hypothetical protein